MFLENKYSKWYFNIIKTAQLKIQTGYTESHHIIPKCLGGTDSLDNLVTLTAREHFICHRLLVKMCEGHARYKMISALAYFSNNTNRKLPFTSRESAIIREANSIASSTRNKGNQFWKYRPADTAEQRLQKSNRASLSKWVNNGVIEKFTTEHEYFIQSGYVIGRLPFSSECLAKMKSVAGRPHTAEARQKISKANLGKLKSPEHRAKLSASKKLLPKTKCEHCNKEVSRTNYVRWHGINCKLKFS